MSLGQKRGTGVGLWGIQGTNWRALPCQLLIPVPHPALQLAAAIMLVCCRDVLKADIKTSSLNSLKNLLMCVSHKWQIFGGKLVSQAHHLPPSMFTFSFYSPVFDRIQKLGADGACEQSCC